MSKNRFVVGSTAFFSIFDDFKSKDIDILELEDSPTDYKDFLQIHLIDKCVFKYRRMSVDEFINITLDSKLGMNIGKFLVPEFCEEINFTINDLKKLEPMLEKLDERHAYEKSIYNSYIKNNKFELTDEQLSEAYELYKKYQKKENERK